MKNSVKVILIVLLIGAVLLVSKLIYSNKVVTIPAGIPQSYATSITKISPDQVKFLAGSELYGPSYKANKKFALYYAGAGYPLPAAYTGAIAAVVKNPDYKKIYNFIQLDTAGKRTFTSKQDAESNMAFMKVCNEFCIVNPAKNELFFIKGISAQAGSTLTKAFIDLKSW